MGTRQGKQNGAPLYKTLTMQALLYACWLFLPGLIPAQASTTSEMFRTQAVLELYEGKHEEALVKLNQSIESDPQDYTAIYYRGIVNSRLGNYEQAIKDIELATSNQKDFEGLYFELGFAYYFNKNLKSAQASLEQAQKKYPNHAPAKYYLGLVYYQQGLYDYCIEPLTDAVKLDPEFGPSSAYLVGDAYIKLKRYSEAETLLTQALNEYPDSVYHNPIKVLLSTITNKEEQEKPYALTVTGAYAYDSNVGLFPEQDQSLNIQPIETKSDSRAIIKVDGNYKVYSLFNKTVKLGGQFFTSRHASLSQFDLGKTALYMDLRDRRDGWVWGGKLEYAKVSLDTSDYQESKNFIPNLVINHNDSLFSLTTLLISDTDYLLAGQELRGYRLYDLQYRLYFIGKKEQKEHYFAGVRYATNDAINNEFDNTGYVIEGGYGQSQGKSDISASLSYGERDYKDSLDSRKDKHLELGLKYSYPFLKSLTIEGSLLSIKNPSSSKLFDYSRNVTSLALRWQL